jgi:hypothetical protein
LHSHLHLHPRPHHQPTTKMPWPLPAELTFKILDLTWDSGDSPNHLLKHTSTAAATTTTSLSLVCSSWRDYSQERLFRTLKLTLRPDAREEAVEQWIAGRQRTTEEENPDTTITQEENPSTSATHQWNPTTIRPSTTCERLQALASPSSSRLIGYVRSLGIDKGRGYPGGRGVG